MENRSHTIKGKWKEIKNDFKSLGHLLYKEYEHVRSVSAKKLAEYRREVASGSGSTTKRENKNLKHK